MNTVAQNILEFFSKNNSVFPSAVLQKMEWKGSDGKIVTPQTVGRELRKLAEDGEIQVELIKNHAHYSAKNYVRNPEIIRVRLPDGSIKLVTDL